MMLLPSQKNHHYVPQFYLRNFSSGKTVSALHLRNGLFIPVASIRGQCQRAFLYGSDLKVEKLLSELEGKYSPVIKNIISTNFPPQVGTDAHAALVSFISVQRGRTPEAGERTKKQIETLTRYMVKNVAESKLKREIKDEDFSLVFDNPILFHLNATASVGVSLMDMTVKVLVNKTNNEFITSDSPVIMLNTWSKDVKSRGVIGYASTGLQVFLPISPNHIVLLYDPAIYNVGRQGSSIVNITSNYDMNTLNGLQLLSSEHLYFYSKTELPNFIKNLPSQWRGLGKDLAKTVRAVSDEDNSEIIHQYEQHPDIEINLSFVRIREQAKKINALERRGTRPGAKALDETVNGPRSERYARPSDIPRKFRVVDER